MSDLNVVMRSWFIQECDGRSRVVILLHWRMGGDGGDGRMGGDGGDGRMSGDGGEGVGDWRRWRG